MSHKKKNLKSRFLKLFSLSLIALCLIQVIKKTGTVFILLPYNVELAVKSLEYNISRDLASIHFTNQDEERKIRNIIITTYRSGSTFLGEAIFQAPGTFYHFEPLAVTQKFKIEAEIDVEKSLKIMKSLLRCDYKEMEEYLEFQSVRDWHDKNELLQPIYRLQSGLRKDPGFVSRLCSLFPFQVMKIVRLPLKYVERLLREDEFELRVLYLVRDPRGTMSSTLRESWCKHQCSQPSYLCQNLEDDYNSAVRLSRDFMDKFRITHYEELALNPMEQMKTIYNFLGLRWSKEVENYIESHTRRDESEGNPHSTVRESKSIPLKWMQYYRNHTQDLIQLQRECKTAMALWGYTEFSPESNNSTALN